MVVAEERYRLRTPNRVRLIYVDKIPHDIESLCKSIHSLFDQYEEDGVLILNEQQQQKHTSGAKIRDEDIVYVNTNNEVDFIYLKDSWEITFGHIVSALAKFPNAQITIFHTDRCSEDEIRIPTSLSIVDTNLDELNAEDWRVERETQEKKRGKKRKMSDRISEIDATHVLNDFKSEFFLRGLEEM